MPTVRTKRVEIRLKPSELACLEQTAKAEDLTKSEYVRKLVLAKCKK